MRATKRYTHVAIRGLAHVDAPHVVTSADLEERLAEAFGRLKISNGLLEKLAGIARAPRLGRGDDAQRGRRAGRRGGPRPQRGRPRGHRRADQHLGEPRPPRALDGQHRARPHGTVARGRELRSRERVPRIPRRHERGVDDDRGRRDRPRPRRRRRDQPIRDGLDGRAAVGPGRVAGDVPRAVRHADRRLGRRRDGALARRRTGRAPLPRRASAARRRTATPGCASGRPTRCAPTPRAS